MRNIKSTRGLAAETLKLECTLSDLSTRLMGLSRAAVVRKAMGEQVGFGKRA